MKLLWEEQAWVEYCQWQRQDKKTLKKILSLFTLKMQKVINTMVYDFLS